MPSTDTSPPHRWAINDELHLVYSPNSTSWSSVMMSMMLGLMFRRSPWTRPRRPWPRVVKPKQTSGAARTIIQARLTSCIIGLLWTQIRRLESSQRNLFRIEQRDFNSSGFLKRSKQRLLWLTEIGETKKSHFSFLCKTNDNSRSLSTNFYQSFASVFKLSVIYFHIHPQEQQQTIENLKPCTKTNMKHPFKGINML